MKLLVSCDEYCFKVNGEFYISERAETFAKRYLAVFENVIFAIRTKEISKDDLPRGYRKNPFQNLSIAELPFFQGPKQYARVYFKVKSAAKIAVKNVDIAILRLPSTVGFAIWRQLKSKKIPYATEIVFDCYDAIQNSTSIISKCLWSRIHKNQVQACNEAVGVSCVTAKYLQQHYFPMNDNALVSNYSSIELEPEFLHHERKAPQDCIYNIVHVANQVQFNGRKGHNQILEALTLIEKKGIKVNVTFVGGDYHNGIAKLKDYAKQLGINSTITFTGFITKKQLREKLLEADIAVLPTRAEGLPRVVIEAMATGLPCITSPVSGNPELINKRMLVEYNDVNGLCEAITSLMTNNEIYEEESMVNFRRSQQYTTTILNPRRSKFYSDLKEKLNSSK